MCASVAQKFILLTKYFGKGQKRIVLGQGTHYNYQSALQSVRSPTQLMNLPPHSPD